MSEGWPTHKLTQYLQNEANKQNMYIIYIYTPFKINKVTLFKKARLILSRISPISARSNHVNIEIYRPQSPPFDHLAANRACGARKLLPGKVWSKLTEVSKRNTHVAYVISWYPNHGQSLLNLFGLQHSFVGLRAFTLIRCTLWIQLCNLGHFIITSVECQPAMLAPRWPYSVITASGWVLCLVNGVCIGQLLQALDSLKKTLSLVRHGVWNRFIYIIYIFGIWEANFWLVDEKPSTTSASIIFLSNQMSSSVMQTSCRMVHHGTKGSTPHLSALE